MKISIELGHNATSQVGFVKQVEKYFQGHHEWWVHPGVTADNTDQNIQLRGIRGHIVVLWDCDEGGGSAYGLYYRTQVNKHPGHGDFDNFAQAWTLFYMRAAKSTYSSGFYEMESAWTEFNFLGIPIQPRTAAGQMNPKVTGILFGRYGNDMSQKGIIAMDFGTDVMINQIIDVTCVCQFKWLTHWFTG